ncbi:hypothetical protein IPC369_11850 [Pseudomonas aeruginosa]|uniref:hypothetical protein n=1 Tax=Pseudomonas aeruginosa TaxID=287 RepID=UPI000F860EA6|nr:hypothetical protein [Pseudomonas aeruginosa]RUJ25426.1 hypothetical protein IPC380_09880 [Pseudomonas aeruginosa]RUJ43468.1 hypothetical protein IPC369_11850 [Pseudomonas aeruginosa]
MLTIFMASASLACWVCTERTAQRGFGFTPAKGLAKLIDNVPHLLAFVASAGLMVRADTLDARSPRLRKRSDALATMDGRRIWRLTSMYTTILMIVLGVPAFSLLLHLLN